MSKLFKLFSLLSISLGVFLIAPAYSTEFSEDLQGIAIHREKSHESDVTLRFTLDPTTLTSGVGTFTFAVELPDYSIRRVNGTLEGFPVSIEILHAQPGTYITYFILDSVFVSEPLTGNPTLTVRNLKTNLESTFDVFLDRFTAGQQEARSYLLLDNTSNKHIHNHTVE